MRGRDDKIILDDMELRKLWREHFEKLSNEEFDWDRNTLVFKDPVSGPAEIITQREVRSAIKAMKEGKAAGPSGVVTEMLNAAGESGVAWITDICNLITMEETIPEDWKKSWMVSIYKGKGDALDCNSHRLIKLLDHAMKL